MFYTILTFTQLEMGVPKKSMTLQSITSLKAPMKVRSGLSKLGSKGKKVMRSCK